MEMIRHLRYRQATNMLCSEWYYDKKKKLAHLILVTFVSI